MNLYGQVFMNILFRILPVLITSYVVLGNILDFSVLPFLHLEVKHSLT